jgi:beta-xylosidase
MYRNPVICADYSDPDVIRHGKDYYLVASSFNCTPGLPILHSLDLVNWQIVNHAVKNLPHQRYGSVQPGCGIWAPSIRFHAGRFWIFFPMPDEGIYLTTATNPEAQWSKPILIKAGRGLIDPCPLWDDDGRAYLAHAFAASRTGIKHRIKVCPMAPDGSCLLGEGQVVFHKPERHPTIEGPKFLKRNGLYYILAPAGGVVEGWQVALRSRNIYGPYEDRVILETGATSVNGPHQGGLVDDLKGNWWFVHFQDTGLYGRVVHLQPVKWVDDWPIPGVDLDRNGIGEPVNTFDKPFAPGHCAAMTPATSDEFETSRLGLQWQWHANHSDKWYSLTSKPGWLRLAARPIQDNAFATAPHLLMQKFPAREFCVETRVSLQVETGQCHGGLVVMGKTNAVLALRRESASSTVALLHDGKECEMAPVRAGTVRLKVKVLDGGACSFAYAEDNGNWRPLRPTFQAQPGVWMGAKIGLVSWCSGAQSSGFTDFDYFRFAPPE